MPWILNEYHLYNWLRSQSKVYSYQNCKICVSHPLKVSYFLYIFTSPVLKLPQQRSIRMKKINVSVSDIVNKIASPKFEKPPIQNQHINGPIIVHKPLRFEELYKKVVSDQAKNNDSSSFKVLYESKKATPLHTHRVKKKSNTVLLNNGCKSYVSSQVNSAKKSACSSTHMGVEAEGPRKMLKDEMLTQSHTKVGNNLTKACSWDQKRRHSHSQEIDQCFEFLNHEEHSHIRERNQCFLSEKQIGLVLKKLGYDVTGTLYADLLTLLEADIYGGSPSQNLKQVLKIIQSSRHCNFYTPCKESLPKIVDNNLQLTLTEHKKLLIRKYFSTYAVESVGKQNSGCFANKTAPISSDLKSLQKIVSRHQIQGPMNMGFSSPGKKSSNSALNQLILIFDKQKQGEGRAEPSLKKYDEKLEQDMNTFRKIQSSGFQVDEKQNDFSRSLSGDKAIQRRENESIVELKSRLNEALKKSCSEAKYFSEELEVSSFSNTIKQTEKPILSVDVNLGEGISQKIIVYEGETAKQVSQRLASKFTISLQTKLKFQKMLESHLNTMLWKIDELSQQMLTDRDREFE